eukprot:scaffold128_cov198-Alexandrium_tamarense.AAC.6
MEDTIHITTEFNKYPLTSLPIFQPPRLEGAVLEKDTGVSSDNTIATDISKIISFKRTVGDRGDNWRCCMVLSMPITVMDG